MSDMQLLVDLHKPNPRLGPGSDAHTRQALALSGLLDLEGLKIADLGCGTGASTIVLAEDLDAQVVAVDLFDEFLEELRRRTDEAQLTAVSTLAASIDDLPFEHESLDAIWSEGAIYNLGFETGIKTWAPFLKPGGILAVSELTWLTAERPEELQSFWDEAYPQVDLASNKIAQLERHGFALLGYFPLPKSCWLDNYYRPLQARFEDFLNEQNQSDAAKKIVEADLFEIDLYERHSDFVSYGFYIAQRRWLPRG